MDKNSVLFFRLGVYILLCMLCSVINHSLDILDIKGKGYNETGKECERISRTKISLMTDESWCVICFFFALRSNYCRLGCRLRTLVGQFVSAVDSRHWIKLHTDRQTDGQAWTSTEGFGGWSRTRGSKPRQNWRILRHRKCCWGKLKDVATRCVLRPVDASKCVCSPGRCWGVGGLTAFSQNPQTS